MHVVHYLRTSREIKGSDRPAGIARMITYFGTSDSSLSQALNEPEITNRVVDILRLQNQNDYVRLHVFSFFLKQTYQKMLGKTAAARLLLETV